MDYSRRTFLQAAVSGLALTYTPIAWELYDLKADPKEMHNQ